ncbi:sigma-70 family RNA polymerase sigma factor [Engelhardtia mirabilis]|uniref:RNA polymerase sigma factor n=1 Tax=Engelhardtia mirabilis TaxID=2528011 RepID=A0A518BNJ5_9BACT|nr:ECF RNA polymerase sigma factor SigW [Planctomycetes bacterium Pla133]QDV02879.1 ECF RNA polymerase sigma factor SigW [Planctomycetes bacterium Pla86]
MTDSVTNGFLAWRRTGDPRRLAEVFDATATDLLQLALHLVGDVATAEDLVQQTFLAAIEAPEEFDGQRKLGAWLAGILANRARRVHRDRGRALDVEWLARGLDLDDPVEILAHRELSIALLQALDGLPEPYREPALMRFRHGLEPGEIAHTLRRSPGTVRSQLHRAVALLRRSVPAGVLPVWWGGVDVDSGLGHVREVVLARAATTKTLIGASGVLSVLMTWKTWSVAAALVALAAFSIWSLDPIGVRPSIPDQAQAQGRALVADDEVADAATSPLAMLEGQAAVDRIPVEGPAEVPAAEVPMGRSIRVRLVRGDEPVPGRHVIVDPQGEGLGHDPIALFSDREGQAFVSDLPSGIAVVMLASGLRRSVTVPEIGEVEVVIDLVGSSRVSGRVLDTRGMPVAGAEVCVVCQGGIVLPIAESRADGTFAYDGAGSTGRLHASKPGWHATETVSPMFHGKDAAGIDLILAPGGGSLVVTVVGADGAAAVGADVLLAPRSNSVRVSNYGSRSVWTESPNLFERTDERGNVHFDDVAPGDYQIGVRAAGHAIESVDVRVDGVEALRIVLEAAVSIRGRVTEVDGNPVAGAVVYDRREPRAWSWDGMAGAADVARTDDDGSFELRRISPGGKARLAAKVGRGAMRGAAVELEVEVGPTGLDGVELVVPAMTTLSGQLVGDGGSGLEGWGVSFSGGGPGVVGHSTVRTGPQGEFEITGTFNTPGDLEVQPPGISGLNPALLVEDVEPGTTGLLLQVPAERMPTAELRVRVTDSLGNPVRDVQLWVSPSDSEFRVQRFNLDAGSDGVTIGPLAATRLEVQARSTSMGSIVVPDVDLLPFARRDLSIVFEQPGAIAFERPPEGSQLDMTVATLERDGVTLPDRAWCDPGGQWSRPPLQPGVYTLKVFSGDRRATREGLRVEAGQTLELGFLEFDQ